MKKLGILNSELSAVISQLGHTDQIVICDAGLPIPDFVTRIDLAVVPGLPSFADVVEAVLLEMQVEKAIVADELAVAQPPLLDQLKETLPDVQWESVSHESFKDLTKKAKAIIRTGECSPYANVILQSGVTF
ncbi:MULTISPECIES: D-ribose pyranase [Brevibacillus]|uniref:D-ribose pyranase n=1 Tax=Brevibacillus invocatus TaxID=173959 RepID=A0A3M8CGS8_9BACL|nr:MULTISPECIES: D-ribose pyranase [Brevibacillus]MCM3080434.1 D-ribose pyranase [Brevibacillus invocatus]MCM3430644.1 D-ribose pyranase [Brevibacillus invocatus]MDH4616976.1 D-ribose pyranase [Brevibacillus sp. AY1]RNB74950.1 D-ribose pyranase [Brevibacillus invocatus]